MRLAHQRGMLRAKPRRIPISALLLAAPWLQAQQAGSERVLAPEWDLPQVEQRLASDQPVDVAWAGYCIAERNLRAAVPAVRTALARLAADERSESTFARMLLLDALIETEATLTVPELRAQSQDSLRAPLLVLAARTPEASLLYFAERFDALAGTSTREWRVCGNMLAARAEPSFALNCVQALSYELRIVLVDSKPPPCRCRCFVAPVIPKLQLPAGFPPIPVYRLDASNDESRANGLRCLPFQRERLQEMAQLTDPMVSTQRAYRDWLCSMGDRQTKAACDVTGVERRVTWCSVQQLRKAVLALHEPIARRHQAMLDELARAGRIPAGARSMRANVDVVIDDCRGEPDLHPLPPTASLLPR